MKREPNDVVIESRYCPPLCTQGDIQYCAPPESRHQAQRITIVLRGEKKFRIRQSYTCDGKFISERAEELTP